MKKDEIVESLETLCQGMSHLITITERLEKEITVLKAHVNNTAKQWMSVDEFIEYIPNHPSKRTIYEWIRAKKIPSHKLLGSLIFNRDEIDEWIIKGVPEELAYDKSALNDH